MHRELCSRIEHECDRSPVGGENRDRLRDPAGTPSLSFSIPAVFWVKQELFLLIIKETVGPAEICSLIRANQHLRGALGIVFRRELVRPERVERIAIVHRNVDAVMPRDSKHLTETRRPANAVVLFLSKLVLIELPDS